MSTAPQADPRTRVVRTVTAPGPVTALTVVTVCERYDERSGKGLCGVWGTIQFGGLEIWRTPGSTLYDPYAVPEEAYTQAQAKAVAHLRGAVMALVRR